MAVGRSGRKRNLAFGVDDVDNWGVDPGDEDDNDPLPFACFICRQPFVDSVVTKCKHYFCEHFTLKILDIPMRLFCSFNHTNDILNSPYDLISLKTTSEVTIQQLSVALGSVFVLHCKAVRQTCLGLYETLMEESRCVMVE